MYAHLNDALKFVLQAGDFSAVNGIILFNFKANEIPGIVIRHIVPCNLIPGFKSSDSRVLIAASLNQANIVIVECPDETYQKEDLSSSAFVVRLMFLSGVRNLFLLNTSSALRSADNFILLLDDHINLMFKSPLTGPNLNEFGPRFPDMSEPYDKMLQEEFRKIAKESQLDIVTGVYVYNDKKPETDPAILSADAYSNNLVAEVIVARHAGMKVAAFSIVSKNESSSGLKSDALLLMSKIQS